MIKTFLFAAFILCSSSFVFQPQENQTTAIPSEAIAEDAGPKWGYGMIDIVESHSNKIYIRWQGTKTQSCAKNDDIALTVESVGGKEALDRAFNIALTALQARKPLRVKMDGCIGTLQRGTIVQICAKSDCSY